MVRRLIRNIRHGRMQKLLAAATALSAPPLAFEIYLEHYKASFGDRWMWTPIYLTPPLTAAGIAGFVSPKAARTVLPFFGALYALGEAHYNLVMGPPLLAPGSLALVGGMGALAAVMRREK